MHTAQCGLQYRLATLDCPTSLGTCMGKMDRDGSGSLDPKWAARIDTIAVFKVRTEYESWNDRAAKVVLLTTLLSNTVRGLRYLDFRMVARLAYGIYII